MGAEVSLDLRPAGSQIRERGGEFGKGLLARTQSRLRLRHASVDACAPLGTGRRLALELFAFGGKTSKRRLRIARQLGLAVDIGAELHQAPIELGRALARARLLAIERFAGDDEALQGS